MVDYQGNTDKAKDANGEKKIVKVVTGEVIKRPQSVGRKFKNVFFGGTAKMAGQFVLADVLLPGMRHMVIDMIENGARKWILGESRYRNRDPEYTTRTQYSTTPIRRVNDTNLRFGRGRYVPEQPNPYRTPEILDRQDIILEKKEDAELVVERMIDIIDKYQVASLADLYDLLGDTSPPIYNKWGWTSLANVDVRQIREGYLIDFPPMEVL